MLVKRATLAFALLLQCQCFGMAAEQLPRAQVDFFETKVRPLLVERCYKCHSHEAAKLKGGLSLESREGVLRGGDSGPAIVQGDPEKSLLIKAIRYSDENLQMPPKGEKLSSSQITDLETWVKMGAPDPRVANPTSRIRGPEICNMLEIKAGILKVCTTPAHFLATCSAVIFGGGCSGNFNFNRSSNTRCSGSGCV